MKIIPILFVGDSITQGLQAFGAWLDNTHQADVSRGLGDIVEDAAAFVELQVNTQLRQLEIPVASIRINVIVTARPGLTWAQPNVTVDEEHIPGQLDGRVLMKSLRNLLIDHLIVALGTNDAQDFTSLCIHKLLTMLDAMQRAILINSFAGNKELFTKLTSQTADGGVFQRFNEQEARSVYTAAESNFSNNNPNLATFMNPVINGDYYTSSIPVLKERILTTLKAYLDEKRNTPFGITLILPKNFSDCVFPNFHPSITRISLIREAIRDVAKILRKEGHTIHLIDMDAVLAETAEPLAKDGIHFSDAAYANAETRMPLIELIMNIVEQRLLHDIGDSDAWTQRKVKVMFTSLRQSDAVVREQTDALPLHVSLDR